MAKIKVGKFNEEGKLREVEVEASPEALAACWAPVRFMGGGCDLYYVCTRRHGEIECQAVPSREAREKADHPEAGEEVQPEHRCAICEELIELGAGNAPYRGEEGTSYAGEPICDICFDEDLSEPKAKIIRGCGEDEGEAQMIGSCRNETEGDFEVVWHSTDPWRGYYQMTSPTFTRVWDDTILSGHESEERLKKAYDAILADCAEAGIEVARCFPRTSNLFACGLELWVQKGQEEQAQRIVDKRRAEFGAD